MMYLNSYCAAVTKLGFFSCDASFVPRHIVWNSVVWNVGRRHSVHIIAIIRKKLRDSENSVLIASLSAEVLLGGMGEGCGS